ncbi:MAG: class II aldolase/adducin family protein [Actinobacteria bacterium]|nr:class II aldolase/adducin family protein [Actinomycetota bacterium]
MGTSCGARRCPTPTSPTAPRATSPTRPRERSCRLARGEFARRSHRGGPRSGGQGAFLGEEVPVYDDARLIRGREAGEALAEDLGNAGGIVMRGNGAVTVGTSVGAAAARMWVLERSAEMNQVAASAGTPRPLGEEEFAYWESVSEEILERIWGYLKSSE